MFIRFKLFFIFFTFLFLVACGGGDKSSSQSSVAEYVKLSKTSSQSASGLKAGDDLPELKIIDSSNKQVGDLIKISAWDKAQKLPALKSGYKIVAIASSDCTPLQSTYSVDDQHTTASAALEIDYKCDDGPTGSTFTESVELTKKVGTEILSTAASSIPSLTVFDQANKQVGSAIKVDAWDKTVLINDLKKGYSIHAGSEGDCKPDVSSYSADSSHTNANPLIINYQCQPPYAPVIKVKLPIYPGAAATPEKSSATLVLTPADNPKLKPLTFKLNNWDDDNTVADGLQPGVAYKVKFANLYIDADKKQMGSTYLSKSDKSIITTPTKDGAKDITLTATFGSASSLSDKKVVMDLCPYGSSFSNCSLSSNKPKIPIPEIIRDNLAVLITDYKALENGAIDDPAVKFGSIQLVSKTAVKNGSMKSKQIKLGDDTNIKPLLSLRFAVLENDSDVVFAKIMNDDSIAQLLADNIYQSISKQSPLADYPFAGVNINLPKDFVKDVSADKFTSFLDKLYLDLSSRDKKYIIAVTVPDGAIPSDYFTNKAKHFSMAANIVDPYIDYLILPKIDICWSKCTKESDGKDIYTNWKKIYQDEDSAKRIIMAFNLTQQLPPDFGIDGIDNSKETVGVDAYWISELNKIMNTIDGVNPGVFVHSPAVTIAEDREFFFSSLYPDINYTDLISYEVFANLNPNNKLFVNTEMQIKVIDTNNIDNGKDIKPSLTISSLLTKSITIASDKKSPWDYFSGASGKRQLNLYDTTGREKTFPQGVSATLSVNSTTLTPDNSINCTNENIWNAMSKYMGTAYMMYGGYLPDAQANPLYTPSPIFTIGVSKDNSAVDSSEDHYTCSYGLSGFRVAGMSLGASILLPDNKINVSCERTYDKEGIEDLVLDSTVTDRGPFYWLENVEDKTFYNKKPNLQCYSKLKTIQSTNNCAGMLRLYNVVKGEGDEPPFYPSSVDISDYVFSGSAYKDKGYYIKTNDGTDNCLKVGYQLIYDPGQGGVVPSLIFYIK